MLHCVRKSYVLYRTSKTNDASGNLRVPTIWTNAYVLRSPILLQLACGGASHVVTIANETAPACYVQHGDSADAGETKARNKIKREEAKMPIKFKRVKHDWHLPILICRYEQSAVLIGRRARNYCKQISTCLGEHRFSYAVSSPAHPPVGDIAQHTWRRSTRRRWCARRWRAPSSWARTARSNTCSSPRSRTATTSRRRADSAISTSSPPNAVLAPRLRAVRARPRPSRQRRGSARDAPAASSCGSPSWRPRYVNSTPCWRRPW